jgi:hypothetical protein
VIDELVEVVDGSAATLRAPKRRGNRDLAIIMRETQPKLLIKIIE